jgi:hypothetical protein
MMSDSPLFKWRHFTAEMILCAVHWYLRCTLSYRDYEAMHMICKGQLEGTAKRDVLAQNGVIDQLFGVAA